MHTVPDGLLRLRAGPPGRGPELCHWKPLSWHYPHHRRGRVQSNTSARHRSVLNSPSWHQTRSLWLHLIRPVSCLSVYEQDKKLAKHKYDPSMKWTDSKERVSGRLLLFYVPLVAVFALVFWPSQSQAN